MHLFRSLVGCAILAIITLGSFNNVSAQERNDEEVRKYVNQLEEKMHKYRAQLKEINAALEKLRGDDEMEKQKQLRAHQKELNNAIARIENEFVELRKRFEQPPVERRRQSADRPQDDRRDRPRPDQPRREVDENPEVRAARNQLNHLRQAMGHLREARMDELAQAVGQRAEKIAKVLADHDARQRQNRERAQPDRPDQPARERIVRDVRERDVRVREGGNEGFQREMLNAIRELNAAVRSLRNDVEELKRKR